MSQIQTSRGRKTNRSPLARGEIYERRRTGPDRRFAFRRGNFDLISPWRRRRSEAEKAMDAVELRAPKAAPGRVGSGRGLSGSAGRTMTKSIVSTAAVDPQFSAGGCGAIHYIASPFTT
ncbi:hypothetical protein NL676_031915 [Syzygium grande]|nr:hypothetical protein NL676_031915 [Syzygium grande]